MRNAAHSVTTEASRVTLPPGTVESPNVALLKNPTGSGIVIYLGSSDAVTSSNGYPLAAGEETCLEFTTGELWAIGSGSGSLRVLAHA